MSVSGQEWVQIGYQNEGTPSWLPSWLPPDDISTYRYFRRIDWLADRVSQNGRDLPLNVFGSSVLANWLGASEHHGPLTQSCLLLGQTPEPIPEAPSFSKSDDHVVAEVDPRTMGLLQEPLIAQLMANHYEELRYPTLALSPWDCNRSHPVVFKNRRFPHCFATPDYFALDGEGILNVQIKWSASAARWAKGVPIEYRMQVQQEMFCAGLERTELCLLLGRKLHIWPFTYRPDFMEAAIERLAEIHAALWAGELPDPSGADLGPLRSRYAEVEPETVITLSGEQAETLCGLWAEKQSNAKQIAELKRRNEAIEAKVRHRMQGNENLVTPRGTFRRTRVTREGYVAEPSSYTRLTFQERADGEV